MEEKYLVKVSGRSRANDLGLKKFSFGKDQIPQGALLAYRQKAWEIFEQIPFPKNTDEAWRRTDIRSMPIESFKLPSENQYEDLPPVPEALLKPLISDQHDGRIILYPGGSQTFLSEELISKGVVFSDLKSLEKNNPELLNRMIGQTVKPQDGKFAALASAFSKDGIVLYVPKDLQIDDPLQSILWGPGPNLAHFSHILILLDEGSSATYIHEAASPEEIGFDGFHSGIVEIHVLKNAKLRFVELQSWGKNIWNFSHERIRVEQDASLDWIFGAVGSRLTKNFLDLDLAGRGSSGKMSGFYFSDGNQHLDHDTQQNHLAPDTTSDLMFKGALLGKSRSVWQGMIYVAPEAQKTDGYQANRNLILSDQARADSIPGLEILADDVRCTHGATVGKLEQEPLFYLMSRGISLKEAEQLAVEGFFDPIMQRIPFEGVRERFQRSIIEKMGLR